MCLEQITQFFILAKCFFEPWEIRDEASESAKLSRVPTAIRPFLMKSLQLLVDRCELVKEITIDAGVSSEFVTLTSDGGARWEYFSSPIWQLFSVERTQAGNRRVIQAYSIAALKMATYFLLRREFFSQESAMTFVRRLAPTPMNEFSPLYWRAPTTGYEVQLNLEDVYLCLEESGDYCMSTGHDHASFVKTGISWLRWQQYGFTFQSYNCLITRDGELDVEAANYWSLRTREWLDNKDVGTNPATPPKNE